jgi:carbonic anhydrase
MEHSFKKILQGYQSFREMYTQGGQTIMQQLADEGQRPQTMIVACCDSRVDPALILQCEPGDLFVVRNVANIIPPYEKDKGHHGTSAALEFGICYLNVKHLIILGHSQCGGIHAMLNENSLHQNDFISTWVNLINIDIDRNNDHCVDDCAKRSLLSSYQNALTFPWIKERIEQKQLAVHVWYFDIKKAEIYNYTSHNDAFELLDIR